MPQVHVLMTTGNGTEGLENSKCDGKYLITGLDGDDLNLRIFVESLDVGEYIGLIGKDYTVEWLANDIALITVPYEQQVPQTNDRNRPTGSKKLTINSGTTSQNVKTSLATVGEYAAAWLTAGGADPDMPDFDNAVNVDESKAVAGVDINIGVYSFTLTEYRATASVTEAYLDSLDALKTKTNVGTYVATDGKITRTFAAGTLLYLGYTLGERSEDDYEIVHNFEASPNVTGFSVGDIPGIAKKGHEYLWIVFQDRLFDDNVNKVPWYAKVEKMYDTGNFSVLP